MKAMQLVYWADQILARSSRRRKKIADPISARWLTPPPGVQGSGGIAFMPYLTLTHM
jgi:hypothetical protein